jgi:hypothetical protein
VRRVRRSIATSHANGFAERSSVSSFGSRSSSFTVVNSKRDRVVDATHGFERARTPLRIVVGQHRA